MPSSKENTFLQSWPTRFMIFLGIVEIVCSLFLIFTELGNVASNFWITNVFAGGWCGLIMLIHSIMLLIIGCCLPGRKAAFRVVILTIVALLACAVLISFDALFIAQPSTCLLTSSCSTNAASTTIFSYSFQQNFLTTFNTLGPFQTYTLTQAKLLFQGIQIGVGCICFCFGLVYLGVYYFTIRQVDERVRSSKQKEKQDSHATRPVPQEKKKTDYKVLRSSYQPKEEDDTIPRPFYQKKKNFNDSGLSNQLQERDFNIPRPFYQQQKVYSVPGPLLLQQEKDYNAPRPLYLRSTSGISRSSKPDISQVVPAQVPEEADKY